MIDLAPFQKRILDECGLFFEGDKGAILVAGIGKRMACRSIRQPAEYLELLDDEQEVARLIELLTINETYFYREAAHLDILARRMMPEISVRRGGEKARILSAGCSTGEEPYSIAIRLLERFGEEAARLVSVIAVDIDNEALRKARAGVFGKTSFRGLSEELRDRYFSPWGNSFRIRPEVQQLVTFERANLRSAAYPAVMTDLDVVFYRNVSIYFPPLVQQEIFGRLADCLVDSGFLFVSATETLSYPMQKLSLIEVDGCFLYHRGSGQDQWQGLAALPKQNRANPREPFGQAVRTSPRFRNDCRPLKALPPRSSSPPAEIISSKTDLLAEAEELVREKRHVEAERRLSLLLEQDPTCCRAHVLQGSIMLNLGRYKEAAIACQRALEIDRWCLEGTLLLGMIARAQGDTKETVRWLREAVYIDRSCWIAHFLLGEIHASRGEHESARREYQIVIRILEKKESGMSLPLFPLPFESQHLINLCRHRMTKLSPTVHTP